ncbi:MAG: Na+/H+ antiporter NhaC [Bacillota bacterium]|jgi:NhaC family Na+:H+ antiporter
MTKKPGFIASLVPVGVTSALLLLCSVTLYTSMHAALIVGGIVACGIGLWLGYRWADLQQMMVASITPILPVVLILIMVGALMGIWIASGTVPAMVYYGLRLVGPRSFLPLAFLLCAGVSLAIGTAFGTTSTIGLAMLGVGQALGLQLPLVAGAIVSGVYFGDRLSPLGSALNTAAAVTETDIYRTMRHMLITTVPPLLIALAYYAWQGSRVSAAAPVVGTREFASELSQIFTLSPWLLLPPAAVMLLAALRMPAIPTLTIGAGLGAGTAVLWQGVSAASLFTAVQSGFHSNCGNAVISQLLNRGGISSMTEVTTLLIIAMAFSGVLEGTGMLQALLDPVLKRLRTVPQAVVATAALGSLVSIVSANQSLPIIVMGRAFRDKYQSLRLSQEDLARTLLDSASIICPLIPWNLNGLFMHSVLGVAVLVYSPHALYCWLTPLTTIAWSFAAGSISLHRTASAKA